MRPAAAARGWRKVAQHVHNSNGLIDALSASPRAPYFVASLSDEGLQTLASSPTHSNQKNTTRSNFLVLDRIVSRFRTGKGVFKVGLGILQITSAKRCPQVWPWVGMSLFSTNFVEFDQAV